MMLFAAVGQPAAAASSGDGERLLAPNGVPLFITGMNYEGPADRAWQMWEDGKFDPPAIDADFTRASQGGVNAIRLFVQPALAADLAAGKFDKLDSVVQLAEKHSLQLIVSLHDYPERDLAKVSGKLVPVRITSESVPRRLERRQHDHGPRGPHSQRCPAATAARYQ